MFLYEIFSRRCWWKLNLKLLSSFLISYFKMKGVHGDKVRSRFSNKLISYYSLIPELKEALEGKKKALAELTKPAE